MEESGIAAVTVAGMVVGNVKSVALHDLLEFKEQLTLMLIGMLFVLLAADVRLAEVQALGLPGVLVVAALILIIRPLSVGVATWGSEFRLEQKAFLSWIGPRGIVAAAVASLFAIELERHGLAGYELRARVLLVIILTVTLSGITGGPLARLLGLRRPQDAGWAILGANELSRALARTLVAGGQQVVCIDANPQSCLEAERDGLKVIYGNGFEERTLLRAEIDTRAGAIGLTGNEEVNLLFVQMAKREGKVAQLLVALKSGEAGITTGIVHDAGGGVLFNRARDLDMWALWLRRDTARLERWTLPTGPDDRDNGFSSADDDPVGLLLPLVLHRDGQAQPVSDTIPFREGDEVTFVIDGKQDDKAREWLTSHGWEATEAG